MLIIYSSNIDWKPQLIQKMQSIGFDLFNQSTATVPHSFPDKDGRLSEDKFAIMDIETLSFSDQKMNKSRNHQFAPVTDNAIVIKISVRRSEDFSTAKEKYSVGVRASRLPKYKNKFMSIETDRLNIVSDAVAMAQKFALDLRTHP